MHTTMLTTIKRDLYSDVCPNPMVIVTARPNDWNVNWKYPGVYVVTR